MLSTYYRNSVYELDFLGDNAPKRIWTPRVLQTLIEAK